MIGSPEIKRFSKIKFLGVLIDKKISWEAHVKSLTKKLSSCKGNINQIADSIPQNLHINLYHTLFESYITYGITVWGSDSMSESKLNKLFRAQKNIMRVLFGDKEKFLDKFITCTWARPYPEQNLPSEFYVKEHSQPFFNKK